MIPRPGRRPPRPKTVEPRSLHFVRAALVGLAAGGLALAFQFLLFRAESLRTGLVTQLRAHPAWGWAVLPILGAAVCGFVGWLTLTFAPAASGSGIPHIKAVLLRVRSLPWKRLIPVKFFGGVLGIGAGLSLGREGPTVQLGAAVGQAVATLLRVPRRSRTHLIACGAGAGLAAAFNAPLAGFIFVIEELRRELSPITYGTALIAAVMADIVTRVVLGQLPSFHITGYPMPSLAAMPLIIACGGIAGVGGVLFNRCLLWSLDLFRRWPLRAGWTRVAAAGAVAGVVAWFMPEAVGGGHQTAELVLRGELSQMRPLGWIALLLVVKFVLTMLCYGSGAPGGIFAPLLLIGALLGLLMAELAGLLLPLLGHAPAAFAVLGMAAYFSAVVRAPLTGVILIVEMTANYDQMFALLVVCLVAYVVAERMGDTPVYEALLRRELRDTSAAVALAEPDLVHAVVESHSVVDGRQLCDALLPVGCLVVTVRRGGQEFIPQGQTRLQAGDEIVVAIPAGAKGAQQRLFEVVRCSEF